MRKQFSILTMALVLFSLTVYLSSCEKDEGKLPNISFKTGGSYTSADKSVNAGDSILVGINASKSEDKDVLKTLSIVHTINSSSTTYTDQTVDLASSPDTYSHDWTFFVPGVAGDTAKYVFTVVNRDGLVNSLKLNIRVN